MESAIDRVHPGTQPDHRRITMKHWKAKISCGWMAGIHSFSTKKELLAFATEWSKTSPDADAEFTYWNDRRVTEENRP